ncbi:hypothetical protein KQX54_004313 [Cotesia glomerata]|uniref:Uncharacterized protein n=1 Tax=Cotesia glomerata TaxID=32391 RepID=A0AAV7I2F6_COTGL|nr:hypothetical protein KQX54_004313 [Cotesia glomerata]
MGSSLVPRAEINQPRIAYSDRLSTLPPTVLAVMHSTTKQNERLDRCTPTSILTTSYCKLQDVRCNKTYKNKKMCSLGVSRSCVRSKVKPLGINKRAVVCGSRKRAKGLKIRVEEEERNNNG